MRLRLMLLLCAALALTVGVATAAAAPGSNSANAKKCQKGGWTTLFRSDGSSFASEEDCVSYAAQGGTLTTKTKSQLDCESFGGTFTSPVPFNYLWGCTGMSPTDLADLTAKWNVLQGDCSADSGQGLAGGWSQYDDGTIIPGSFRAYCPRP